MSRVNPTGESAHPCGMWLEWKGGEGCLSYWDKNRGEKGERVAVDVVAKPFVCIPLARTNTVRGYSKATQQGIRANEVTDLKTQKLSVKFAKSGDLIAEGLWSEIRDTVCSKRNGGGFAINLYMAYKDEDGRLKIGCFQIGGCALGAWIDFEKTAGKAIWQKAVIIGRGNKDTTGSVDFYPPVFALKEISKETDDEAGRLQAEIRAHLANASANEPKQEEPPHPPQSAPEYQHAPQADDVPF